MLLFIIILGVYLYIFRGVFCFQISFLGLGLVGIYFTLQKMRNEHIVIAEKEIEYHSPGIIIVTKWENAEKISNYWHNGFRHECILVDNSKIVIKKWSSFLGRTIPAPFESFSSKTIIPLSCFSENWRDSDLGQQIKQYAPHLFEKEKSVQSAEEEF